MKRAVLADTGPLYAATDTDDQYHARAHQDLERLRREHLLLVVPYPTLLESYSLALHHLGLRAAHTWLEEILSGTALVNPTQEDYRSAALLVRAYPDQPLTMFDTVLAILSQRLGSPVWTYDHHFDVMRADIWR